MLTYVENVITEEEHDTAVEFCEEAFNEIPQNPVWKMRHFGADIYGFSQMGPLVEHSPLAAMAIVRYLPGEGLEPHIDVPEAGEIITTITVGGPATVRFKSLDSKDQFDRVLNPRSKLTISGNERWNYTHEVLPVDGLRYAMVFRNATGTKAHAYDGHGLEYLRQLVLQGMDPDEAAKLLINKVPKASMDYQVLCKAVSV